jgi:hypothetical protein
MASRMVKRGVGGIIAAGGFGIAVAFVLAEAWFGVAFGAFVGLLGAAAFVSPDEVFPAEARELPTRGAPPLPGEGDEK